MAGPIEQFAIKPIVELGEIGGQPVAFTNSALSWCLRRWVRLRSCSCRPTGHCRSGALAVLGRALYEFVSKTLRENAGEKA